MLAQPQNYVSLDAYFTLEETSGIKHEYYRGVVYAMTGASPRHNLIATNVIASLHAQLRGKPCTVYPSDLRLKVEHTGLYTYPDSLVVCDPLRLDSARPNTILNPTVLVEILSPSTKDYDRGTKFQHYRTIETFQEYVVIEQDRVHIEHYVRQDADHWLLIDYHRKEQVLNLQSIGCQLTLEDVYEKVIFEEEGGAAPAPDTPLRP